MSHIVPPVANVPLLILIEVISLPMPLVILPVPNIELLVIVKAPALLSIPCIFLPPAMILISTLPLLISTRIYPLPISLLLPIDVTFECISIRVLNTDHVTGFDRLMLLGGEGSF
jgi:hypothetical protein